MTDDFWRGFLAALVVAIVLWAGITLALAAAI